MENIPITEHLAKTLLLIWTNDSCRLQINVEISIDSIIAEIVFF